MSEIGPVETLRRHEVGHNSWVGILCSGESYHLKIHGEHRHNRVHFKIEEKVSEISRGLDFIIPEMTACGNHNSLRTPWLNQKPWSLSVEETYKWFNRKMMGISLREDLHQGLPGILDLWPEWLTNCQPHELPIIASLKSIEAFDNAHQACAEAWTISAVVHGDAKLSNLLETDDARYITDFERMTLGNPLWDTASILDSFILRSFSGDPKSEIIETISTIETLANENHALLEMIGMRMIQTATEVSAHLRGLNRASLTHLRICELLLARRFSAVVMECHDRS